MGRVISVVSGKGGVGKTTVVANLGIALAKNNHRVCLVDADFGLNNLDISIGVENRVVYDVMDVLKGNCRLAQALVKDPVLDNLYVLLSTKQESTKLVSRSNFYGIIKDLQRVFDYVIVDAPAGMEFSFERAILPAGEVIVVITPTIASLRDARKVIDKVRSCGIGSIKIVVNRTKKNMVKKGELISKKNIENILGQEVIVEIPESDLLLVGYNLKSIFDLTPEVASVFYECAETINYCDKVVSKKRRGVWGVR